MTYKVFLWLGIFVFIFWIFCFTWKNLVGNLMTSERYSKNLNLLSESLQCIEEVIPDHNWPWHSIESFWLFATKFPSHVHNASIETIFLILITSFSIFGSFLKCPTGLSVLFFLCALDNFDDCGPVPYFGLIWLCPVISKKSFWQCIFSQ